MSEQVAVGKLAAQTAEQSGALAKLLIFSFALGVGPLSSYFLSLNYLWSGNNTYAAITAVAVANVVLVGFIITSVWEEKREQRASPTKQETKKTQ
ncbi:hypothetical protein BDW22DRAFT_1481032 [Trametopsis cervina]|nr:hypothetical protein BDW22DRAFT_1481032 [Trametopsis cervina]